RSSPTPRVHSTLPTPPSTHPLSLHDALPIWATISPASSADPTRSGGRPGRPHRVAVAPAKDGNVHSRSHRDPRADPPLPVETAGQGHHGRRADTVAAHRRAGRAVRGADRGPAAAPDDRGDRHPLAGVAGLSVVRGGRISAADPAGSRTPPRGAAPPTAPGADTGALT